MTTLSIAQSITTRFKAQVQDAQGVQVQYDNFPLDPPDDAEWIRFQVLFTATDQVALGAAGTFRTTGLALAQVFSPIELGAKAALALADTIVPVFRGVTADGVLYRSPSVRQVGRSGKWWQVNVSCPFQVDENP